MSAKDQPKRPTAVVMNMFYTGLGIARSLGEMGVPVIGLSAHPGVYGEYTRYARIAACPDSRNEPEALLGFLREMGRGMGHRAVIFPTRDDDASFLDRYRGELSPYFELVVPEASVLQASLDKWETYLWAQQAEVPAPRAWLIEGPEQLGRVISEVPYPCVLKPVASYHWRKGNNWARVGGRKAVAVASREELLEEYARIAQVDQRVLLQEMISGGDDCLLITACYLDHESNLVAAFNTRKLLQAPEGFGTGIIVQATDAPELLEPTLRLLKKMHFTGIAEVEFKWDQAERQYRLIEINPRPWDQHRLGNGCGVNLMYLAYCEHAGLPIPEVQKRISRQKWIAEDAFVTTMLGLLWRRDPKLRSLFYLARGERCYAIWSSNDPLPLLAFVIKRYIPGLMAAGVRAIWSRMFRQKKEVVYASYLAKGKNHG
jgi:predicted ATP-grasp superfamily ATP-dependent carboligase